MLVQLFNSSLISGPETLVIPSLRNLGLPVTVVFLAEKRKARESELCAEYARSFGLPVRQIWVSSRYDRKAIQALGQLLEELGTTLLHAHDVKASTYALGASRIATKGGAKPWKLVSTHHGVRSRRGVMNRAYEWYYVHVVLPHFDRVLAVCTSDSRLLVARGLAENQVRAHLNGVDRPKILWESRSEIQKRIRSDWGMVQRGGDSEKILIGFVGRLEAEKRIDRVLKICSHLKSLSVLPPQWQLVVFGTGSLEHSLKSQAVELGLEKDVVWMGYRSGLGQELAGFDTVISMSDAEGLPINLVEAGWAATPVVATQVDGNLDLFPNERLGFLVNAAPPSFFVNFDTANKEAAEKLSVLINNPSLRQTMGLEFQKHVSENFSSRHWIQKLLSIYGELQIP